VKSKRAPTFCSYSRTKKNPRGCSAPRGSNGGCVHHESGAETEENGPTDDSRACRPGDKGHKHRRKSLGSVMHAKPRLMEGRRCPLATRGGDIPPQDQVNRKRNPRGEGASGAGGGHYLCPGECESTLEIIPSRRSIGRKRRRFHRW